MDRYSPLSDNCTLIWPKKNFLFFWLKIDGVILGKDCVSFNCTSYKAVNLAILLCLLKSEQLSEREQTKQAMSMYNVKANLALLMNESYLVVGPLSDSQNQHQ